METYQNDTHNDASDSSSKRYPVRRRHSFGRFFFLLFLVGFCVLCGFLGAIGLFLFPRISETLGIHLPVSLTPSVIEKRSVIPDDAAVVDLVEKNAPGVVSIIISKDIPKLRSFFDTPFGFPFFDDPFQGEDARPEDNGTEKQTVGQGSGFIVSPEGLIVTNKHVVSDTVAEYTVLANDGKEYPATVLARDPNQDIAIMKIEGSNMPALALGDSESLKVGQSVIAIGNSLGEFSNTVSRGIVSGLGRNLTAGSSFGPAERLTNIIQTDAAINPGNSGGPLLNIAGAVIGVNVAMAQGAENIGFALPITPVKRIIEQVQTTGKISTPFLGIRYVLLDETIQKENNLPFSYGALVARGENRTDFAVIPGSPADKAGIIENDIILEIEGKKVDADHPIGELIAEHRSGREITLKIWRKGETKDMRVTLEERDV